jgi:restriction system protein
VGECEPVPSIPPVAQLYWPTIRALRELGGSGTVGEVVERVIELEGFSEEQQAVPHTQGTRTELEYRLAWARTHLKMVGLLENSARGVWSLTDDGRRLGEHEVTRIPARVRAAQIQRPRRRQERSLLELAEPTGAEEDEPDWKEGLLSRLLDLPPDGFERLAGRLLREAGFVNVTITGRAGDGGIDAVGVHRVSLLTFPVYVQCKRHRGRVGAGAVRDFRGAMAGRGEKGLLVTTGSFTADARREATRDGAPPIDLVDGEELGDLLKQFGLGVQTKLREIEEITIEPSFFDDI